MSTPCEDASCPSYGQMGAACNCQPSASADFLSSINARFDDEDGYRAAVKAAGEIMRQRDEARQVADDCRFASKTAIEGGRQALAERDAARALLREAGEVVKPFAVWAPVPLADHLDDGDVHGPDDVLIDEFGRHYKAPSLADLRRARAFLDKLENTDG